MREPVCRMTNEDGDWDGEHYTACPGPNRSAALETVHDYDPFEEKS